MDANELAGDIARCLGNGLMRKSGAIFYSSRRTLQAQSTYYLMGLNPGGNLVDREMENETICRSLLGWLERDNECWSEYSCVAWNKAEGKALHQQRVQGLCSKYLRTEVTEIFCANAIFLRSPDTSSLLKLLANDNLLLRCREVHRNLLKYVKPKFIICLGHDTRSAGGQGKRFLPRSSFYVLCEWLRQWKAHPSSVKHEHFQPSDGRGFYIRWFDIFGKDGGTECRVIGVPHPSWFELRCEAFDRAWRSLALLDSEPAGISEDNLGLFERMKAEEGTQWPREKKIS